jgi:hypothetical protein
MDGFGRKQDTKGFFEGRDVVIKTKGPALPPSLAMQRSADDDKASPRETSPRQGDYDDKPKDKKDKKRKKKDKKKKKKKKKKKRKHDSSSDSDSDTSDDEANKKKQKKNPTPPPNMEGR